MVVFPNAKINLGLHVLRKRPDGYHDIETCFYPVPLCDVMEVLPGNSFSFTHTGLEIPGKLDDNLIVRAYRLLANEFGLPAVQVHLHKVIPMGAGLGGGSADASFMLIALNNLFDLGLDQDKLMNLAASLGSDCPFFIRNAPAIGSGTGTILEPVNVELSGNYIAILHPGIHVSTSEAYAALTPVADRPSLESRLGQSHGSWQGSLLNDFSEPVYELHPEIGRLEEKLQNLGAFYTSMSGSGSAVFGLFTDKPVLPFLPGVFQWSDQLP